MFQTTNQILIYINITSFLRKLMMIGITPFPNPFLEFGFMKTHKNISHISYKSHWPGRFGNAHRVWGHPVEVRNCPGFPGRIQWNIDPKKTQKHTEKIEVVCNFGILSNWIQKREKPTRIKSKNEKNDRKKRTNENKLKIHRKKKGNRVFFATISGFCLI